MSEAAERLKRLRDLMKREKTDVFFIPSSDDHNSEYVAPHDQVRRYFSGFTGSAGTLIVTWDDAGLWTDGRYHVQAERELSGSGIRLYKAGLKDVISPMDYLRKNLRAGSVLAANGYVIPKTEQRKLAEICEDCSASLRLDIDPAETIWKDRPKRPANPAWRLEDCYAGESAKAKLKRLRECMQEEEVTAVAVGELESAAWLLNLRGSDITHVPVAMCFVLVTNEDATLYIAREAVDSKLEQELLEDGVKIAPYEDIYKSFARFKTEDIVWMDSARVNARLYESALHYAQVYDDTLPISLWKATKNDTEVANIKKAHVEDAVAMITFLREIKEDFTDGSMTERDVEDRLLKLRSERPDYIDLSFETISAYGPNAAMMHYSTSETSNAPLHARGFLLVDSGGHYKTGTTDITRTIVLGPLTEEEKRMYTLALKGHFQLSSAVFREGITGYGLDILAREPLWEQGVDYLCGTGHGVGYALSVHEGPNAIRWILRDDAKDIVALKPGMITTDEPGVYEEGKFGIRLENELLCIPAMDTVYGRMLKFEPVTYVPFDRDAIDVSLLTPVDIRRIDEYHEFVYNTMAPHLKDRERTWLYMVTRPLDIGD